MILDDLYLASRYPKKIELDHFVYRALWNTLGATATTTVTVPLDSDSDFVLRYLNLVSYSAVGVIVANPDYLLTLFDSGSGRNLQDAAIHVNTTTGTGQLPFILPEPKLFKGGGSIALTLQNQTAVAARVDVALIGLKVFYLGGYNRDVLGF